MKITILTLIASVLIKQRLCAFYSSLHSSFGVVLLSFSLGCFFSITLLAENRSRVRIKKSSELVVDESTEDYTLEKMELLKQKRRGLIEDIRRFLRESKSEHQKAELGLRLASLYMEDYHALTSESHAKENPNPSAASEAKVSLDRAINIYRALLTKNPNHNRRDEMFYFLGVASLDKNEVSTAMSYFTRLVQDPGASRYKADAQVQLGDYYFDRNQHAKAIQYYDRVIHNKNKKLLSYAIYKKAWCLYNEQKFLESIKHFKWVATSKERDTVRVRNEAIRDIALPFSELKLIGEATAFYDAQEPSQRRQGIEVIAGLLKEKGAYENAIAFYNRLIAFDANHKKNPQYEIQIIDSLKLMHRNSEAIERLFSRLSLYGINSNWYELNSSDPASVKELHTSFEETARRYALESHAEGQKTKNDALYGAAKSLYERYLEHFPLSSHAPKIRFYLAEIYFKETQFLLASDHYYQVYKSLLAAGLRMDGLRYAIRSLDRLVNDDRKKQGLPGTDSSSKLKTEGVMEVTTFSDVEKRFLSLGDEYVKVYPSQSDIPAVLYEQSYLRYAHYDFTSAHKGFWNLIQRFPKDPISLSAAYLVLDMLNRRGDYAELVTICKQFLGHPDLGKPIFKTEVARILRHSELKQISQIEEKGNFREAALRYLDYTRAYGALDETLFEKALYNASINFTKAELYPQAVETQERFLRRFPRSALRQDMLLKSARTYEMMANFEKAALAYGSFSNEYPDHPQTQPALRLSGIYYWGAGHPRQAQSAFDEYRKRFPTEEKLVINDLIELYESTGQTQKQMQLYRDLRARKGIRVNDYVSLSLKIMDLELTHRGKVSRLLEKEIEKVTTVYRKDLLKTPKGIEAISRVSLLQMESLDLEFHKAHLGNKKIEMDLKRKLALLKELDQRYTAIARLGSPEHGLMAMAKTAHAYSEMAIEVAQAPVPGELSSDQIDIYRQELNKEWIRPFQDRAKILSRTCLEKSMEYNLSSVWVPRCYFLASQLDPKLYPSVRSFYLPPLSVGLHFGSSAKTKLGTFQKYNYPYNSPFLFTPPSIERTAFQEPSSSMEQHRPVVIDYRALETSRRKILDQLMEAQRPAENETASLSYLNLARLVNPLKAAAMVLRALELDPKNTGLHNLLALSYLEQNQPIQAKVTLLSLLARGEKSGPVLTNLGVIAYLDGKEEVAAEYWNEAIRMDNSREASLNLAFHALRFRNGFEAKKHFERALSQQNKDASSQVGMAVALLQNMEIDLAKEKFTDLYRQYKSDPYARITTSYYLMDIEGKPELAEALLADYIENQNDESAPLRQALSETKRSLGSTSGGVGLPTIGN